MVPIIPFAPIVGKLTYLTNIHPNIKYVRIVNICYMSAPCQTHIEAMRHIFKYDLQDICEHGILYHDGNMNVVSGYICTNWANNCEECKSIHKILEVGIMCLGGGRLAFFTLSYPLQLDYCLVLLISHIGCWLFH